MRPRLLPKSEINKRKAEEQRLALQEGLKVAEKVDSLRETLAKEEAAFESYRTESLKGIQEDINVLQKEKESLVYQVSQLRKERLVLQQPLDAEWEKVTKAQAIYNERKEELEKQRSQQASTAIELERRLNDAVTQEGRSEDLKKLASAMFSQADTMVASAKEESANMRNKAHAELLLVEVRQVELTNKEKAIALKEAKLAEREKKIETYEIDLAKREQTLRAGWKNLERTKQKLNL